MACCWLVLHAALGSCAGGRAVSCGGLVAAAAASSRLGRPPLPSRVGMCVPPCAHGAVVCAPLRARQRCRRCEAALCVAPSHTHKEDSSFGGMHIIMDFEVIECPMLQWKGHSVFGLSRQDTFCICIVCSA